MPITYFADTDVCIKLLKKKDRSLAKRFRDVHETFALSDVTVFELYSGAQKYDDRLRRIAVIEEFLGLLPVLPFNSDAARHAGEIRGRLEMKGLKIGAYDVQLAGIARSRGLIIATGNVREFQRVEGLRVEKWG